jgi:hypothetical protein
VLKVINEVNHDKFVLAHYGAHKMWDETLELLAGKNVYFDTAFTLHDISKEKFSTLSSELGFDVSFLGRKDCIEERTAVFDALMLASQTKILGVYIQDYDSRTNDQMKKYLVDKKNRKEILFFSM